MCYFKVINIVKHFIICFLCLIMISIPVKAEDEMYSFGHFYYHSHEGYVSICGYLGRETDIEIPNSIAGKPVSEIESGTFNGCNSIETIKIPDTVVLVYSDSFSGASRLKKIVTETVGVNIIVDESVEVEYLNKTNSDNNIPADKIDDSYTEKEENSGNNNDNTGDDKDIADTGEDIIDEGGSDSQNQNEDSSVEDKQDEQSNSNDDSNNDIDDQKNVADGENITEDEEVNKNSETGIHTGGLLTTDIATNSEVIIDIKPAENENNRVIYYYFFVIPVIVAIVGVVVYVKKHK